MKLLIQRVENASVFINGNIHSSIGRGLLVLVGFSHSDTLTEIDQMTAKLLHLRVFTDAQDKMNLSIQNVRGEMLIVSQFTLYGDCRKGNRPSFTNAAKPEQALPLYDYFVQKCKESDLQVKTGEFGAYMQINSVNDGPVTIVFEM